jgi:hypothetical protein
LDGATVTREEINERYEGRASSGIMLILYSLPMFEPVKVGRRQAVQLRHRAARLSE